MSGTRTTTSGTRATAGLDRLRPRRPEPPPAATRSTVRLIGQDVDGKRALYSGAFDGAVGPGLAVECSRCGRTSPLSVRRAVGVLVPSLHLPVLRAAYPSLVRCPTCRRASWVRFRLMPRRRPGAGAGRPAPGRSARPRAAARR